jgi:hypothetical protein
MLFPGSLEFALPGPFGEDDPDSPCRESGEQEKQYWQQLAQRGTGESKTHFLSLSS